jgi:hypothetical protein
LPSAVAADTRSALPGAQQGHRNLEQSAPHYIDARVGLRETTWIAPGLAIEASTREVALHSNYAGRQKAREMSLNGHATITTKHQSAI